ncbi:MAG TPA: hypothetical protein PKE03_07165 [Bacteroidales bacterium]|nr:hypothetical protein [Bacteroidales bacterium]
MKKLFGGNSMLNGLIIGILVISISAALLLAIKSQLENMPYWLATPRSNGLLALIPNVILMRIYFINRKSDLTGRGILIITFAAMLAIFLLLK